MDLSPEYVVVIVVIVALLGVIYYYYKSTQTLQSKVNTLTDSINTLQDTLTKAQLQISQDKTQLTTSQTTLSNTQTQLSNVQNTLSNVQSDLSKCRLSSEEKDTVITQIKKAYQDYVTTTNATIEVLKANQVTNTMGEIGSALNVLNKSVADIGTAIILYHTSLNNKPELLPLLKYIFDGISALYSFNNTTYQNYLTNITNQINENPGTYVALLNSLCANDNYSKILDDLYAQIVGTYQVQDGPTNLLIPQTIPNRLVRPYSTAQLQAGQIQLSPSILQLLNIDPFPAVSGTMLIRGLVTFIQTLKNIGKKYCGMNINANTILGIYTQAMQEIYDQYTAVFKSLLLPMYNFIVTNNTAT